MAAITPPIVVLPNERPPMMLRRSETWEDEVREVSQARLQVDLDDETRSYDRDFRQSTVEDLLDCIDTENERRQLATYLPNKITAEARSQCHDSNRLGLHDGHVAYEQALHTLDSPLGKGLEQWKLAKVECHLELGDVEAARALLREEDESHQPSRRKLARKIVDNVQHSLRSTRGELSSPEPRPRAVRRHSTLNTDLEYEKMLRLQKRLHLALEAQQWDQVDKTKFELHGLDPEYFNIKHPRERFVKIRQLLSIGQLHEREASVNELDPIQKRQFLEAALRTYNHGCYATELFHQHFEDPLLDHMDCANLFFSAARICIAFQDCDFKTGSNRKVAPRDCKVEPTLGEDTWAQQALYFLEQGRSRALLDSIIRGEEFFSQLQRKLLGSAINNLIWAAQASILVKKRDSLFPDSPPQSPPSQAVSPSDSPPEAFRLYHATTIRAGSPSPAFRQAVEQSRRRSTFGQSSERPLNLESEDSPPRTANRSPRGSFTEEEMRRVKARVRWQRVKLHLFSEVNPAFNAAVAALPNAGKSRFRELRTSVPEGVVVIEYGLPSSSPNGLLTLAITSNGVKVALWQTADSKRIRTCVRTLRGRMHEEYALVRRDAPSPSSPTKSLHSQTEFDDATVEEMRLELYNLLVKPIEVFLRSIVPERVIIVPSGELAHVPWAMFLDVPFSIVPSLSIWHRLHLQSPPDTARAPNVSVFSNKPYDEEGASRDIPYARIEALYLSWLHAKRPALADDINRETFEKRFSGTLEILHLCAHSDFDYRDPLKSSVQLFKEPWSMDEWRKMAIRAHIVVFSSCLSAISKAYDSGSTLSFAHTLLATGTRAFVGSLWPVEDEATLLLMMLFYDGLRRPLAPDAALYQAQLRLRYLNQHQLWEQIEMLKAMFKLLGPEASTYVNSPRYWIRRLETFSVDKLQDPRYWAAFVLTGYGFRPLYPPLVV